MIEPADVGEVLNDKFLSQLAKQSGLPSKGPKFHAFARRVRAATVLYLEEQSRGNRPKVAAELAALHGAATAVHLDPTADNLEKLRCVVSTLSPATRDQLRFRVRVGATIPDVIGAEGRERQQAEARRLAGLCVYRFVPRNAGILADGRKKIRMELKCLPLKPGRPRDETLQLFLWELAVAYFYASRKKPTLSLDRTPTQNGPDQAIGKTPYTRLARAILETVKAPAATPSVSMLQALNMGDWD